MRRWPNVGLLLAHRLGRLPNSKPTWGQCLIFAGYAKVTMTNNLDKDTESDEVQIVGYITGLVFKS